MHLAIRNGGKGGVSTTVKNASHLTVWFFSPAAINVASQSPHLTPIKWCYLVSQSHYHRGSAVGL